MANSFFYHRAGAEQVFLEEIRLLQENGHTVVPFSMKHPANLSTPFTRFFVSNIDFQEVLREKKLIGRELKTAFRVFYSLETKAQLEKLLACFQPDIAHLHNFQHHLSPSLVHTLWKHGIPIVWTLHDYELICPNTHLLSHGHICEECMGGRFYKNLMKRCKKNSWRASLMATTIAYFQERIMNISEKICLYLAPSDFLRRKLIEFGIDGQKINVVRNFVRLNEFTYQNDENGYLLYAGRLDPEKGINTLIDAVLPDESLQLCIVGEGNLQSRLKNKVARNGASHIHFLGFKTQVDLRALISRASCVILPSEWYENCPIIILEAFASGKPVIAARIGGIPEIIEDGKDGLLFESGNATDLRMKIQFLKAHPALAKRMGSNAHSKVESSFNPEIHYERLLRAYRFACSLKSKSV